MSDERDKSEAETEADEETSKVGEVVDPREEHAKEEEDGRDGESFEESLKRMLNHVPTDDDLNNKISKETEVRSSRTNFWFIR